VTNATIDGPRSRSGRRGPGEPPADGADSGGGGGRRGMGRRQAWITIAMAILILIPSMYGFLGKFIEFIHIYRGTGGGEFAVAPIMNYLLASAGFFCMLLWAAWNGMFRDIERPKFEFLENEARIDAASRARHH
jgi:uncharacterized membrane protein YqaE (UPF0057 family)